MKRIRLLSLILVCALLSRMPVAAFHVPPWDTGHNSFQGDPGDPDNDPGNDSCNSTGSPFEIATGNFIYSVQDVFVRGLGPSLSVVRTYNAQDMRDSMFGQGWSFSYESRLVETADGTQQYAVCREGDGKRLRFVKNADGSFKSPPDNYATLTRDSNQNFRVRQKDGLERRFDADGRLVSVTDRNGNSLTLSYDNTGFLTGMTDAGGRTVTLTKGANGKVESLRDHAGRVTSYTYDAGGNLLSSTDPTGARTQYQYDGKHNLTRITDPRGNVVQQVTYDNLGRVTGYVEDGSPWTVTYTPAQKRTTKRDSRGNSWVFTFNDNKNITATTDPLSGTEAITYDANFNVASVTDKRGGVTAFKYDAAGNVTEITNPKGQKTQATYEPTLNLIASTTDAAGNTTRFEYDAKGNMTKVTDAAGGVTRLGYDGKGLLTSATDALGNTTLFTYDGFGNLTGAQDALGNTVSMVYDAAGNVSSVTDALGRQTQYSFDAANHLTQLVDALGGITRFTSDASGNLTAVTDAAGRTTSFEYDAFGRPTKITNPLGQSRTYTYGPNGNLASAADATGATISYTYDALDRVTRKSMPGNVVNYTYDRSDNLLTVADNDTSVAFTYDNVDQVTQTTASAQSPAKTLQFTYDTNGNRKTMTDPQGRAAEYSYDALLRLTSLKALGVTTTFSYDGFSRRAGSVHGNGLSTTYGYDAAHRMSSMSVLNGATPVAGFIYGHDKVGNRVGESETQGAHAYAYDPLNRLTSASHPQSDNPAESFAYDKADNRVASHLSSTHRYDDANRLLEDAAHNYSYNAAGMLVQKVEKASGRATAFAYDAEGQLTRITFHDGGTAAYKYDGLGRRVEKNVRGQVTRYVYDSEDIVSEYSGTDALTASYVHGSATDEPLIMERGGQNYFYHQDSLGSVRFLTDSAGSVAQTYVYDSYGNIVQQTGMLANPYAFTGREFDAESGLYYYRARYYDPRAGRFIHEDPVGVNGGLNLYAYVANNPVNYIDPEGKFIHILVGAGASVATGFIISKLTGSCYSWKDALFDAGTGAVGAGLLSKVNKLNRIRQLRNIAKSRGLSNAGTKGYTETWKNGVNALERLEIKHSAGTSAGLQPGSLRPRFGYRVGQGTYWDPFTGATGPKGALSHIPLEPALSPGAAAGAGAVTGAGGGAARSGNKDCGCK